MACSPKNFANHILQPTCMLQLYLLQIFCWIMSTVLEVRGALLIARMLDGTMMTVDRLSIIM